MTDRRSLETERWEAQQDPHLLAVFAEFRRIGFTSDKVPVLTLPSTVTREDFLARLRAIPDGAGFKAFRTMMAALPQPPQPFWYTYPDAGDRFSHDDYMTAYRLIDASPEHLATRHVRTIGRRGPEVVTLALLSHVSPELAARVDRFRDEVRQARRAQGIGEEALAEVDEKFEWERDRLRAALSSSSPSDGR